MGKKKDLSAGEKTKIVDLLANGFQNYLRETIVL
jgi:hypothetical protein